MHGAGHCKRLADTWGDLGAAFKDSTSVAIGHIDCTAARDVCSAADVSVIWASLWLLDYGTVPH